MDQIEIIRLIGTIFIIASTIMANLFVVVYQIVSPWRRSEMGRHIMNFGLVLAVILDTWALGLVFGPRQEWYNWVRLIAFAGLPYVLFRQVWMLLKIQVINQRSGEDEAAMGETWTEDDLIGQDLSETDGYEEFVSDDSIPDEGE